MNFLEQNILTLVTFVPLAGAVLLAFFNRRDRDIRVFSFLVSLLTFGLSLHLPVHFHRSLPGFQYEIDKPWISSPNIHYHMAVDGISLWLVVLTTFLTPLCVLISWKSIHDRVKEFLFLLGSDVDPNGAADRRFRARAQGVRSGKVLHVHDDRVGIHAGGDLVAVRAHREL